MIMLYFGLAYWLMCATIMLTAIIFFILVRNPIVRVDGAWQIKMGLVGVSALWAFISSLGVYRYKSDAAFYFAVTGIVISLIAIAIASLHKPFVPREAKDDPRNLD